MSNFRFDWSSGTVIDIDYPSYEKSCFMYHLAYWKNGRIIE